MGCKASLKRRELVCLHVFQKNKFQKRFVISHISPSLLNTYNTFLENAYFLLNDFSYYLILLASLYFKVYFTIIKYPKNISKNTLYFEVSKLYV